MDRRARLDHVRSHAVRSFGERQRHAVENVACCSDVADQCWHDWVMSYDLERQIALFTRMRESGAQWHFPRIRRFHGLLEQVREFHGRMDAGACGVWRGAGDCRLDADGAHSAALVAEAGARAQVGARQDSAVRRHDLYTSDSRLLAKRGIQKPPWLTPVEFARVLTSPHLSALAEEATSAYNELRFGGTRRCSAYARAGSDPVKSNACDRPTAFASSAAGISTIGRTRRLSPPASRYFWALI